MSSYRHQNPNRPQGHYYNSQRQQYQHQARGQRSQELPQILSPQIAGALLLTLFILPLILLFASQFGGLGEYIRGSGMFRNLGLGLAYPKWKDGQGQTNGREGDEWRDDSDSGSDGKRKVVRHRRADSTKEKKKSSIANGDAGGNVYYPGLINISGTYCFLNSVVQGLASLDHLEPYLNDVQDKAEELDVPTPVIDALKDAMIALNTPRKRPTTLKPLPLIEALSSPPPNNTAGYPSSSSRAITLFASREHQDAQELFVLLSERVKEEALAVEREWKQSSIGLRGFDPRALQKSGGGSMKKLKNPFDGLTANRRSCVQCGYTEAVMHFHFNCWSLSLPRAHTLHLEDCLADYTRIELLDDCVCRKCSLLATLERVTADIERIVGPSAAGSESKPTTGRTQFTVLQDGEADPSSQINGDPRHDQETKGGLSESKKRRLRDLRRVEKRLKGMLEEGRIEEELELHAPSPTVAEKDKDKSKKRLKKEKEKEKSVGLERVVSKCSTRQSMIARPPPILAIHLSRTLHFGSHAAKNSAHVLFERELDLTPYTTSGRLSTRPEAPISSHPESSRMGRLGMGGSGGRGRERSITPTPERVRGRYRLTSVVCHYGSAGWGHYVCYRRQPVSGSGSNTNSSVNGEEKEKEEDAGSGGEEDDTEVNWVRTSDSQVDYVSWDQVRRETSGVFMLFYERVIPGPYPSSSNYGTNSVADSMTTSMTGSWMIGSGSSLGSLSKSTIGLGLSASLPNLNGNEKDVKLETSELMDSTDVSLPRTITRADLRNRSPSMSSQETIRPRPTQTKTENRSAESLVEEKEPLNRGEPSSGELKESGPSSKGVGKEETVVKEPGSRFTTYVVTSKPNGIASESKSASEPLLSPKEEVGDLSTPTPTLSTLSSFTLLSEGDSLGYSSYFSDASSTTGTNGLPNGVAGHSTSTVKKSKSSPQSAKQAGPKTSKQVSTTLGSHDPAVRTSNSIGLKAY